MENLNFEQLIELFKKFLEKLYEYVLGQID